MSVVAGLIFAGGRGTRLGGVIKANITINGVRLVDRVASALLGQTELILLSAGRLAPGDIMCVAEPVVLADPPDIDMGPVGGLVSAVEWCRTADPDIAFLLSVAVDTPDFPSDFLDRALDLMAAEIDVVLGAQGGQTYPTNALWRLSALADLPDRVRMPDAHLGLKHIVPAARQRTIDYSGLADSGSFDNINTPDDLAVYGAETGD